MRLHVRRTFKHCNVEAGHKAGIDGILHIVATCKRSQGTRKGLTDLKMPAWVADGPDFPQRVRLLRRQHRIRPDVRESLTRWLLHAPVTSKLLETVTKDEMLSLFLTRVHPSSPSRSKLSVHMISQKTRPKRVSVEATTSFEAAVS